VLTSLLLALSFILPATSGRCEPKRLCADGCTPNPFAKGTSVNYELAQYGTVALTVHDVSGRLVRRLESGPALRRRHIARWDGTDGRGRIVPAGVYFVRLSAGGEVSDHGVWSQEIWEVSHARTHARTYLGRVRASPAGTQEAEENKAPAFISAPKALGLGLPKSRLYWPLLPPEFCSKPLEIGCLDQYTTSCDLPYLYDWGGSLPRSRARCWILSSPGSGARSQSRSSLRSRPGFGSRAWPRSGLCSGLSSSPR